MTTIKELIQARLEKGNILPPLKESWKEYSILSLILVGGIAMGCGMPYFGGISLLAGGAWSITETINS